MCLEKPTQRIANELPLQDIAPRTTKVRPPRINRFVERMNSTLLDEHFRIKGRGIWRESVEDIQTDLDIFIEFYNLKHSHQAAQRQNAGAGAARGTRHDEAATDHPEGG